jgi:hypothetical protein
MYPALKCMNLSHDVGNSFFHRQDHEFQMRLPCRDSGQYMAVSDCGSFGRRSTLQMPKYSLAKRYGLTEGIG